MIRQTVWKGANQNMVNMTDEIRLVLILVDVGTKHWQEGKVNLSKIKKNAN